MGGTSASLTTWLALLLTHPLEFRTLVQFQMFHTQKRDLAALKEHPTSGWDRASMRRCWELLDMTSRSFAAVIKELEGDLTRTIALFYLVLRGLDTIEDDMTIPDEVKQPLLRSFHIHCVTPGWKFDGCGPNEKDRQLLVEFDTVVEEVNLLQPEYRSVIVDITQKMATGMADYAHKAATSSSSNALYLSTIAEYELYCHYVAGLLGEGLSRLFAASGKEAAWLGLQLELSNSMGLLLQKTNIIRDFREDVDQNRFFWPREIWGRAEYGGAEGALRDLKELCGTDSATVRRALNVQSGMILDALRHATDALDYLQLLTNQSVFNFCAIPATMALATLELCFMNPEMFQRHIKIRKAEAASLIMRSTNPQKVGLIFREYARKIHAKAIPSDPNFIRISIACGKIEAWYEHNFPSFVRFSKDGKQMVNPADRRSAIVFQEDKFDAEQRKLAGPGAAHGEVAVGAVRNGNVGNGAGEGWVEPYDPTRGVGVGKIVLYIFAGLCVIGVFAFLVVWGVLLLD